MIEVTDEMCKELAFFHIKELTEETMVNVAKRIIELHEANKPTRKPLTPEEVSKILLNVEKAQQCFGISPKQSNKPMELHKNKCSQ